MHFGDRRSEVDESINKVQPGTGHAAAGRFARIVAPAARDTRRMLVAEMPFDVQDLTENACGDDLFELAHRGEAALVVAEPERHTGLSDSGDRPRVVRPRECQGLLAPDRLAGRCRGNELLDMQGMRRRQVNGPHAWIAEDIAELRR